MSKVFEKTIIFIVFIFSTLASAGSALETWEGLVGSKTKNRIEYKFVKSDSNLPYVLLYGDSISIQYTQYVRDELKGSANVYRLYRNGSSSGTFIDNMSKMQHAMTDTTLNDYWSFNWDVIHFNVGLHDLKYLHDKKLNKNKGTQVSSIKSYKENIKNIIQYLKKLAPESQLIFATTTPVPDDAAGRFAGDAIKYNKAALEVLQAFPEVRINDLYSFTKPNQTKWRLKPGDVHYAKQGRKAHGERVAKIINQSLESAK